jgi:hypothetical protein
MQSQSIGLLMYPHVIGVWRRGCHANAFQPGIFGLTQFTRLRSLIFTSIPSAMGPVGPGSPLEMLPYVWLRVSAFF